MKRAIFRPEARVDALEAFRWYDVKDSELAQRFKAEVDRVVGLIEQRPLAYPVLLRGARKALLKRFPYMVVFRDYDGAVVIAAVMHVRRGRRPLKKRL